MTGAFITWVKFQRRVVTISETFPVKPYWIYLDWEARGRVFKALSYLVKTALTLRVLIRVRPEFVMVQLPPAPALYATSIYCGLTRTPLVADCHNSAITEHWRRWPLTRLLLSKAITLVHNDTVAAAARSAFQLEPIVLRTGIMTRFKGSDSCDIIDRLNLSAGKYVVLPWSLHVDEPIDEALEAIRMVPDVTFVLTGAGTKLGSKPLPENLTLSGYLEEAEFNCLFASAAAALVLTTREDTQLSGMAEALALSVPAVISDNPTTRLLYREAPIYVENSPAAIAHGIRVAISERALLMRNSVKVATETTVEVETQLKTLLEHIRRRRE